jgi:hypothetical protein
MSGGVDRREAVAALLGAPLLALLPLVWQLGAHVAAVLAYPWQIDYDEGIVLRAAWMLAQGQNPYHAPRPDAFTSATYPPLFYLLNALWLRLAGPTLLSGRVIALVATLLAGGALAWWVWYEGRSRLAAALTAALWLSLSPVYVWSTFFKPDLPALALTLIGLALARWRPVWPALLGAALAFALAFFTKQSALVGPLAVGLWLLTSRGPWLRFGLATAGLIAVPFAAANAALSGGLWLHVVTFQQQIPWTRGQLAHNLGKLGETYPWLLAAAGLALAGLWGPVAWCGLARLVRQAGAWRRAPAAAPAQADGARPTISSLPIWYLLAVLPLIALVNGRVGVNYGLLLDLFPPLCLLVGIAAGLWLGQPPQPAPDPTGDPAPPLAHRRWRAALPPALGAALSGLLLTQALLPNPPSEWYTANRMPSRERANRMHSLARLVEQTPGRILSEDLWLLLRAGKPVEYDDTFMMAQVAQRGLWDERRFVADLEAQRFALVVLEYDITGVGRSPRWSPAALAALRANYEILYRDAVHVHRPKSLLRAPGTRPAIEYGGQVQLIETAVSTAATRPGGTVRVMVRWQRASVPTADYQLFVHLVDGAGGLRAQVDVPPGGKPTSQWAPGERAEAEYALTLPEDAPPGAYRVLVGLYDPASGRRLPATRAGQPAGDAVAIAEVRVDSD